MIFHPTPRAVSNSPGARKKVARTRATISPPSPPRTSPEEKNENTHRHIPPSRHTSGRLVPLDILHLALAPVRLRLREFPVLVLLARYGTGDPVPYPQRPHDLLVPDLVLLVQVIQQAAPLVHERDEAAPGAEILGMEAEVGGEVGDPLGHAGDLVLGGAGVVLVAAVDRAELGDAHAGDLGGGEGLVGRAGLAVAEEVGRLEEVILDVVVVGGDIVLHGRGEGDGELEG